MHTIVRTSRVLSTLPRLCLFMLPLLVLPAPIWAATTFYVSPSGNDNNDGTASAPYRTIQAAFNNAGSGDTITLEDGTYTGNGNRDLDFGGKDLTVNSRNGADLTILDCGGPNRQKTEFPPVPRRAFFLQKQEHGTIRGITIKNANVGIEVNFKCVANLQDCTFAANVKGIYNTGAVDLKSCTILDSSERGIDNQGNITLTDCKVTGTRLYGICTVSQATLTHCTITENARVGILTNGMTKLIGCTINSNKGSGIDNGNAMPGTVVITECSITDNGYGFCNGFGAIAALTKCTISNNSFGGLKNQGRVSLAGCTLANNTATTGGAVYNTDTAVLTDCVITGNTARTLNGIANNPAGPQGGGIFNGGKLTLTFCSLYGNTAEGANAQGGALENSGQAMLTNCILWNNSAPNIAVAANANPTTNATYCDIQGGWNGTGNIKADPLFVAPAQGDLHLQAGSPCIGKGIAIIADPNDPFQAPGGTDSESATGNTPGRKRTNRGGGHTSASQNAPPTTNPTSHPQEGGSTKPEPAISTATDLDGKPRPDPPTIGAYEVGGVKSK